MPFKFNPITNKLDLVENGAVPTPEQDFVTDAGTATSVSQVINVVGGTGITTTGVGDTVTITSTATAPAMVLLHTITFNNTASSYDITPYVTGYDIYKFIASAVESPTGVTPDISVQFSTNGGTTWITSGYVCEFFYFDGGSSSGAALPTNRIVMCYVNGAATLLNQGESIMTGYGGSKGAMIHGTIGTSNSSNFVPQILGGYYSGATLNGIRIINGNGTNYISGKFSIYGITT